MDELRDVVEVASSPKAESLSPSPSSYSYPNIHEHAGASNTSPDTYGYVKGSGLLIV